MGQDRTGYRDKMVLIEASRILNPQFNPTTISLTGAQVEILRNVMQYATYDSMFVDEYHNTYYLTPTAEDWDTISAIVADLQEVLMGNPNTVFGYLDRLYTLEDHTTVASGTFEQAHPVVPAGEVHRVLGLSVLTDLGASNVSPYAYLSATNFKYTATIAPVANAWFPVYGFDIILKEDDGLRFFWYGLANNQRIRSVVYGYKMKVPD